MKKSTLPRSLIFTYVLLISSVFLYSCTDNCSIERSYTYYKPVYTSMETLRSSVDFSTDDREIHQSGKIYYINNHLLINEPNEGIHFINNSNPSNPDYVGFLTIPGNFDMAAVDGILYVDSYIDLVLIDISNFSQPREIKRLNNVFPNYNSYGFYADPNRGIVTDWVEAKGVEDFRTDCETGMQYYWGEYYGGGIMLHSAEAANFSGSAAVSPSNPGVGGSMARFTISKEHLYMIDQSNMYVASLTDPYNPKMGKTINIGTGIETIFPYSDMLFIGANNGMSIYDISTPALPNKLSEYSHVRSCDPVVTDGEYAYVTLRSGSACTGFTNQLEVIDIRDPRNPELVKTYPMYNPHGLSISNNKLYVCDGNEGLKIYDASDVNRIADNKIAHYDDVHAYDVIVIDCLIMLIGEDGLRQYGCNNYRDDLMYLSHIPFNNDTE